MSIGFLTLAPLLALTACGPPYAWGDAEDVEERQLNLVPHGSSLTDLEKEANRRGWETDARNVHIFEPGEKHYFDDCDGKGGPAVPVIIARYYAPFHTTVESLWIFNSQRRLSDICVRKTVDAL